MKRYRYQARDKSGKLFKGVAEAQDEHGAVRALREKALVPFVIKEEGKGLVDQARLFFTHRVKYADLTLFTRQLSTMITAGLQITDALSLLRMQVAPALAEIVSDLLTSIEAGTSLADAMAKHPEIFSKVYVSLVRTGESAGLLDEVLARLSDNMEKQQDFQSKIKGAMIYPIIILVGMGIVIMVMMIFVIPKMSQLYKDFGAKLPQATQILIDFSTLVAKFWWMIFIIIFGLVYLIRTMAKTHSGKKRLDYLILRMPVIGGLSKMVIMTEFTRTVGLLVGAGVSIVDSLNIVKESVGNLVFEDALGVAAGQVEKGFPLAYALAETEQFPPIVTQMVSVGEETGKVGDVLSKLSRYFENESDHLVKGLTTAIEPLIIIILGFGVGFLVVAIIMPIYSLTSQFQG